MEITREDAKILIMNTYVEYYLIIKELYKKTDENTRDEARDIRQIYRELNNIYVLTDKDNLKTIRNRIDISLNYYLTNSNVKELYEMLKECKELADAYQLGVQSKLNDDIKIIQTLPKRQPAMSLYGGINELYLCNFGKSAMAKETQWINPVNGPISSTYGYRENPFNANETQFHTAIDISVLQGTEILAAASGTVVIGADTTFGNFVALNPESSKLNPDGNIRIITSHMSQINVTNGARVAAGTVIGLSGGEKGTEGAGQSTGPHVDLMVRNDGQNTPSSANIDITVNPTTIFNYQ